MKNKYKVHDIAKKLNLKKHIVRHWEKEFQLSSENDRFYSQEDFIIFEKIKNLIYEKKLSINAVKTELESILPKPNPQNNTIPSNDILDEFYTKSNEVENPTEITNKNIYVDIEKKLETQKAAKEIVEESLLEEKSIIASHETTIGDENNPEKKIVSAKFSEKPDEFFNHLELLKENLLKLKEKLN